MVSLPHPAMNIYGLERWSPNGASLQKRASRRVAQKIAQLKTME
jgi:hypothetical protein